MVIIYFRLIIMFVACYAAECCVVVVRVTVSTGIPFTFVIPAVYWEIHTIVIKRRWSPAFLLMALGTIGREVGSIMIRV